MNVLFFQLIAQQRRHGGGVKAGLVVVEEPADGAGDLLAQGQDRDAHRAGPLAFAAARAAPAKCRAWMVWKKSFSRVLSSWLIQCGSRLSETQKSRHTHMGQALRQA